MWTTGTPKDVRPAGGVQVADRHRGERMIQDSPLISLFVLALPIASIAWTVTHEEVFREPREYCVRRSQRARSLWQRKFFYLFTCEYCFSHWVTLAFLVITRYRLMFDDWRGYLIGGFALVWVANVYMSAFGRLRLDIKHERVEIAADEATLEQLEDGKNAADPPSARHPATPAAAAAVAGPAAGPAAVRR
jgi:hypothetical protein